MQLPGVLASHLDQAGLGANQQWAGIWLSFPTCVGAPSGGASKALCSRTQIRQTCTLPSSLNRLCHCLDSADGQSHWLRPYMGAAGRNSFCQNPSADYCKTLLPFPVTTRFPVVEACRYPAIPVRQDWSGASQQVTHNAGWAECTPWALFSYWRNWRLRGDLLAWCCPSLGEGQCSQHVATPFILI